MLASFIRDLPFLMLEPRSFFDSFKAKKVVDLIGYIFLLVMTSAILFICASIISSAFNKTPIDPSYFVYVILAMLGAGVGLFLAFFAFHYRALRWQENKPSVELSVPIGIYSMSPFVILLFTMNFSFWLLAIGLVYSIYFYHLGLNKLGTRGALNWVTASWGVIRSAFGMGAFAAGGLWLANILLKI
jgi:hypothetical protein